MITRNQWFQIVAIVLGACVASATLWTQLFGQNVSTIIVSVIGLLNTILAGITYVLTGQGQQIRDVAAMPGVSSIQINSQATQAAAQVAVDPAQLKVSATPAAVQQVSQIAKGT